MDVAAAKEITDEDEPKKKGFALLAHDFRQKQLIPIKILSFLILASMGVLMPFMTIHMKSLGITVEETAIVNGIVPPFTILAPSIMGMIADKLGNFKVLLSALFVLLDVVAMLFLLIPTGRFIDAYPVNISLAVGCLSSHANDLQFAAGLLTMADLDSIDCDFKPSSNLTLKVEECGYLCLDSQTGYLQVINESLPVDWPAADQPHHKFRNGLFFSEDWRVQLTCSGATSGDCRLNRIGQWESNKESSMSLNLVTLRNISSNIFLLDNMTSLPVYIQRLNKQQPIQCEAEYDRPIRLIRPLTFKLNNSLKSDEGVLSLTWPNEEEVENEINYKMCRPQCIARAPRSDICANKEHIVVFDPQLTFWLYTLLRLFFGILIGGAATLFEGASLAIVTKVKGDLGLQRIFGVCGVMIFSPISGIMIDHFSIGRSIADYRPSFYLFGALLAVGSTGILFVDLDFKQPNTNLLRDLKSLLKNVELVVFFVVALFSGLFNGYIETYLFWLLEEMGGTKSLMGLTVTVSCLSGIPALLFSDKIFRTIGHPNVQIIGFLVYVIRLIGYSYLNNPYMCLVYEVMESITSALMMTSMTSYAAQLSSTTTLTTVQGVFGAAYFGIGRGIGTFVGGFLMKWFGGNSLDKTVGTRATFRLLGAVSAVVALLYFLFNIFYIRRRNNQSNNHDKELPQKATDDKEIGVINPDFINDEPDLKSK